MEKRGVFRGLCGAALWSRVEPPCGEPLCGTALWAWGGLLPDHLEVDGVTRVHRGPRPRLLRPGQPGAFFLGQPGRGAPVHRRAKPLSFHCGNGGPRTTVHHLGQCSFRQSRFTIWMKTSI